METADMIFSSKVLVNIYPKKFSSVGCVDHENWPPREIEPLLAVVHMALA